MVNGSYAFFKLAIHSPISVMSTAAKFWKTVASLVRCLSDETYNWVVVSLDPSGYCFR